MNKKVYWIVLKNGIIPKIREAKISSWDLLNEFINRYEDNFVGYHTTYIEALNLLLNHRQLFEDTIEDKEQMKQDILHLEQCYKLKQEL